MCEHTSVCERQCTSCGLILHPYEMIRGWPLAQNIKVVKKSSLALLCDRLLVFVAVDDVRTAIDSIAQFNRRHEDKRFKGRKQKALVVALSIFGFTQRSSSPTNYTRLLSDFCLECAALNVDDCLASLSFFAKHNDDDNNNSIQ